MLKKEFKVENIRLLEDQGLYDEDFLKLKMYIKRPIIHFLRPTILQCLNSCRIILKLAINIR